MGGCGGRREEGEGVIGPRGDGGHACQKRVGDTFFVDAEDDGPATAFTSESTSTSTPPPCGVGLGPRLPLALASPEPLLAIGRAGGGGEGIYGGKGSWKGSA